MLPVLFGALAVLSWVQTKRMVISLCLIGPPVCSSALMSCEVRTVGGRGSSSLTASDGVIGGSGALSVHPDAVITSGTLPCDGHGSENLGLREEPRDGKGRSGGQAPDEHRLEAPTEGGDRGKASLHIAESEQRHERHAHRHPERRQEVGQ
jgi:hypothetical protein